MKGEVAFVRFSPFVFVHVLLNALVESAKKQEANSAYALPAPCSEGLLL